MKPLNPHIIGLFILASVLWTGCGSGSEQRAGTAERRQVRPEAAALLKKSQKAFQAGAYRPALMYADSALSHAPGWADVFYTKGRIFTELKRFEQARTAYEAALAADSSYHEAQFNLANNAFRQERFQEALNRYREVLRAMDQAPDSATIYHQETERSGRYAVLLQIGRTYAQLGAADSARAAYRQAIDENPSHPSAYSSLGELYKKQGAVDSALAHAEHALERATDTLQYLYDVGVLQLRAGRPESAARKLRTVVQHQPGHRGAHYNLGQVLMRLGRQKEAQQYLAAADSLEKAQAALDQLKETAEVNPNQLRPWVTYGKALRRAGRYKEATSAYRVALTLAPGSPALQNNLANLALLRGDTTEAVYRYRALLQQDSTLADVWLNLGVVFANADQMGKAERHWRRALQLDPGHPEARRYLESLSKK